VLLEWRPPQDPGDLAVAGYHIYRGLTIAGLTLLTTINSPVTLTYLDGAVSNGVTYHYAVMAFNDLGNSSLSGVLDATPMGLPSEPRNVTTEVGDGHVKLTWEGPLLNGGRPVLAYYLYRAVGDGPMERHAEVCGTSYEENGLTNGVVYRYKVSAFTAFGEGPSTDVLSLRPLGLPGAPTGVTVQVGIRRLNVTWQAPSQTGGGTISGFAVYRGESEDLLSRLIQLAGDVTSLSDSDVVVGRTYHYAVVALTAAGEGPRSQIMAGKVVDLPGAPLNLTATAGDGNVSLSWGPPSYDGATPVTGYMVLRGATPQGLEEIAQLGPVTSYLETGLSNGLTYYYAIVAVNAAGRGSATQAVSVKPVKPVFPPGTPTRLLFSIKDGKVLLQWTPPTSDGGSPILGYVVLRGNSSGNMSAVGDIGLVTSWTDTTAKKGTTYYYSVAAKNAVGQGDRLAAIEVKVPKAKAKTPGLEAPAALLAISALTLLLVGRRRRT
jgi:titin